MAVRTASELQDVLDASFSWRRTELSALRAEIQRTARSPTSPLARAMARSGTAMLYAHWEGFGKDAFTAYADFISKRKLRFSELNDGLLRTVFVALQRRTISGDDVALQTLVEAVRDPSKTRAPLPRKSMVDMRSNLRSDVLQEALTSVGLDAGDFATSSQLIDRLLCDARNEIAHGRERFPSAESFATLHDAVITLMESVRSNILNAVRAEGYRHPPS